LPSWKVDAETKKRGALEKRAAAHDSAAVKDR
jgi:hypothetical protein